MAQTSFPASSTPIPHEFWTCTDQIDLLRFGCAQAGHEQDRRVYTTRHEIEADLAQRALTAPLPHDWPPEAWFYAAWCWLVSRWLGRQISMLTHTAAPDPSRLLIINARIHAPGTPSQWLEAVDLARRSASNYTKGQPVDACWLGRGTEPVDETHGPFDGLIAVGFDAPRGLFIRHARGLLSIEQAQAMLRALCAVADGMLRGPNTPMSQVPLMDALQWQQLCAMQSAPRPVPAHQTVHGVFDAVAQRQPHEPAIVQGGTTWSYGSLLERSLRIETALRESGVRAGNCVGISLPRGPDAIATMLAVLRCHASYVPLDQAWPRERLTYVLGDTACSLVACNASSKQSFVDLARCLVLDESELVTARAQMPASDTAGAAYVMYTSGSTGRPKGVLVSHAGILRLALDGGFMRLDGTTRMLHAAPLGFDASTLEIWGPLLNGGCCVVLDDELPTPRALQACIERDRVDSAWLTAGLFNAVVDDDARRLAGLRQLLIGGEALSVPHLHRALQSLPETRIVNGYGPTECTTFTATWDIPRDLPSSMARVPIGRPIRDTQAYVVAPGGILLPPGLVGELTVGGSGVALGYLNQPNLQAERFLRDPWRAEGGRLYRTGDLVRWLPGGDLDCLGRIDAQLKIRGFRIEPGEIESCLARHAAVRACAVIGRRDAAGNMRLLAYVVPADRPVPQRDLREFVAQHLPEPMVPAVFTWLDALPVTANGKLDQHALAEPAQRRARGTEDFEAPHDEAERLVCEAFATVLGLDEVGRNDHFFELGGNSLLVLKALALLGGDAGGLDAPAFFSLPTPAALAARIRASGQEPARAPPDGEAAAPTVPAGRDGHAAIAIIAVAGRFPSATDVDRFWANLLAGHDGIHHFQEAELDVSLPTQLLRDPDYVRARGVIDGVDRFDAEFFGITPREAALMDPQQRLFMELCWECLERGGYAPDGQRSPVGVFAGMHNATYFQHHVLENPEQREQLGEFQTMLGNEKDYIATRTANRLNLTGPAVSLNTACSTSLVAIAQAVLALRAGQCAMALAGGSSIHCPPASGYLYQEGAMLSPDGRTRSFDAKAAGTVFSDGVAVLLLKPLEQALMDGDRVLATVRGVAVNNDGRDKASFTAPSTDGQAAVIAAALRDAGVSGAEIDYVEAHGTATPLGDPVEVEALAGVLRRDGAAVGSCLLGSVKSNVGHLVIAAGATGVIKTALALHHECIPPSIHYERANPHIDFAHSPLRVCDRLTPWPRGTRRRLAGVSSFGVGGTNAHVVLEESPPLPTSSPADGAQLLMLSARSDAALERMTLRLAAHLEQHAEANLADVAHTLQVGRSGFARRLCVVADNMAGAVQALRDPAHPWRSQRRARSSAPMVWMFSGQGSQYAGMGSGLHARDASFAKAFDAACAAMRPHLDFDLAARMLEGLHELDNTATTQPALFALEYALAQAWRARGVEPVAVVGHSVGEFVCAVLAGIMSLEQAAGLVARRGALMQAQPPGSMLSVRMPAEALRDLLPEGVALAADNGPRASVAAGPAALLDELQQRLDARGVSARRLVTSHAFHSPMMDGALAGFADTVALVPLAPPLLPMASTCTGDWLDEDTATKAEYWVRQLREPVRFSSALQRIFERHPEAVLVELGPRSALCELARQQGTPGRILAIPSLGSEAHAEPARMLLAQGALWTAGVHLRATPAYPAHGRRRVCLPTYSFEPTSHWLPTRARTQAESLQAPVRTLPVQSQDMSKNPSPTTAATQASDRQQLAAREDLMERLRRLFEDVAGVDLAQADARAAFVELGIDSLTLTQAALQIKREFGVPVSFRQLMEQLRSFDALATHLQGLLPQPATDSATPAPAKPPQVAAPALQDATTASPSLGGGDGVRQLIEQQMRLMAQQLEVLGGLARGGVAAAPAAAPTVAATTGPLVQAASATAQHLQAQQASQPAMAEEDTRHYDVKRAFGAIARIHTQSGELTERQRVRLQAFLRRYVDRTAKSRAYTDRYRGMLADPRVVNGFRPLTKEITYQLVIQRSKGSRMWDLDDNEYVDVLSGFGMNLFGWQPDFVLDAVRKQLDSGYDIGPQHPLAGPVAELVCELTGFDRAGLCNTGSEAVMAAVRIARTVTGRDTVVLFTGSYHGTFDEVVVRAGREHRGIPGAPGIMRGMFGNVRVLEYGTTESLEYIRTHADELAAVLVEPVQSRRPEFRPLDFLRELREITERSGTCLIFDEVITGFRSAPGGVQQLFGIRADLATYGKVMGGGMPIGVVAGRREFMDALDGGAWQYGDDSIPTVGVTYFAGTFVRHPLALAAAHASLQHLKQRGAQLQQDLNASTEALADELNTFCEKAGAPLRIRHFASLWRVSWLEDHPLQDLLFAMMRSRGVHILDNFPCFLTTAHDAQDLQLVAQAFKESVGELQESEFLPGTAAAAAPIVFDASRPPVPGARLGRDAAGKPAWFIANPNNPSQYLKVGS